MPSNSVAGLPDDWESWLVHADELTLRGDARGELLVLEQRGGADRARAWELADDWMTAHAERLGTSNLDAYLWIRSLAPLANPPTPIELLPVFAQPISQLLAQLDLDVDWTRSFDEDATARVFMQHRARVFAATLAWIDRAFDGVPVPGEEHRTIYQAEAADNYDGCDRSRDHLGRWQELPDAHLLENQWALAHLDAYGIPYYVPAVMSFALKRLLHGLEYDHPWIIESLEYKLKASDSRDWQRSKFARFDRAQRAAIYAYSLAMRIETSWGNVWNAEREGARDDWFELFSPAGTAT